MVVDTFLKSAEDAHLLLKATFTQYITVGNLVEDGFKMHENRYHWVQFGDQRVER